MKILVTGGAGFIASHVSEVFLRAGHQVVALDDLSSGRPENLPAGARLVEMDINDPRLGEFVASESFEVIDHHAAQISVPQSVEDPLADARVNVLGTLALLKAAVQCRVKRFIFASSGGAVYGPREDIPLGEELPVRPLSPYAVAKRSAELYIDAFAQQYGLAAVCLRYANVYGPRQIIQGEAGVVAIFMDCLVNNKPPMIYRYDDQPRGMVRDYVYVKDCARANLLALEKGQGTVNIGTETATDTLGLWEGVQKAAGQNLDHGWGAARPGDVRANSLKNGLAKKELGWEPQYGLDAGLAETWAWRTEQE